MIRQAVEKDAEILTRISFASKGYWDYPESFFEIWKNELTITPAYISTNAVYAAEIGGTVIGYYALVELADDIEVSGICIDKGFWLEHMFITPAYIRQGIGRTMMAHMRAMCIRNGIQRVKILSDPNARGFYEKSGCRYIREYPSTIKDRTTPMLVFDIYDT